jgi:hypothetical protein
MPIDINGKIATRYKYGCGSHPPKFINHLSTWGEADTVKILTSINQQFMIGVINVFLYVIWFKRIYQENSSLCCGG